MSRMNRFDTASQNDRTWDESVSMDRTRSQNISMSVSRHVSGNVQSDDAYIDYKKFHYKSTIPDNRVLVFLTGFCVGMVFFYLTKGQNVRTGSLLDSEHLALMQNFEVNRPGFLEYVMGLRLKQLLFGVICALSSVGGL